MTKAIFKSHTGINVRNEDGQPMFDKAGDLVSRTLRAFESDGDNAVECPDGKSRVFCVKYKGKGRIVKRISENSVQLTPATVALSDTAVVNYAMIGKEKATPKAAPVTEERAMAAFLKLPLQQQLATLKKAHGLRDLFESEASADAIALMLEATGEAS